MNHDRFSQGMSLAIASVLTLSFLVGVMFPDASAALSTFIA